MNPLILLFLIPALSSSLVFAEEPASPKTDPSSENTDTSEQKEATEAGANQEEKEKLKTIGHPFSWPFMKWEEMKPYGGTTKGSKTVLQTTAKKSYEAIYEEGVSKKEQDRRAILALAGDYRVTFDFIETSGIAEDYKPPRPYFSWATERTFVIEEKEDFISLQHILVMEFEDKDGNIQGPFTMKHWRQDWKFEDTSHHHYLGEKHWREVKSKAEAGTWTQEVFQVDDSPRYEAVGKWTHEGGLSTFTTNNFWRPLPRREFSMRDDYNVLAGTHQIILNPTGWLHVQTNRKVVAEKGVLDRTLATELGAVRYQAITTPNLDLAEEYWGKTGDYWKAVREKWNSVLADNTHFSLKKNVEEQGLFMHLFGIAGELEGEEPPTSAEAGKRAVEIIDKFLQESQW